MTGSEEERARNKAGDGAPDAAVVVVVEVPGGFLGVGGVQGARRAL